MGCLFPDEWFRVVVPVSDPRIECVLKVFHRFECGVGQAFPGEHREPAFDYPALGGVSTGRFVASLIFEASEVAVDAGDDTFVAGGLGVPTAGFGVVSEGVDVG